AELEQQQVTRRREIAVLVEDAVVREKALAVDSLHLALATNRACVEEVAIEVGVPDERDEAPRLRGDLAHRLLGRADEARPQEQILRRGGRDRGLWEQHEISAA